MTSVTAERHVRVCEVCFAENPPDEVRCRCGAMLSHIDLSARAAPPAALAADLLPASPADRRPPAADALVLAAPDLVGADGAGAPARCPFADCAMPNPPGAAECVYCNRPLHAVAPALAPIDLDTAPLADQAGALGSLRRLPSALAARWRIVRMLSATGAEADLFLIAGSDAGEQAVAKIYRAGIAPSFDVLARVRGIVGRPVVQVLDHGTSEGHAWELLEYCPLGTLRDWLDAGPRTRADVVALVRELSGALEALHDAGVLHRDLKPENVLLRAREPLSLALADFGNAAVRRGTQHFTQAARTTMYAAPETLAGIIDHSTDWWAVGMIVLEAASGRHPFAGLSDLVIAHRLATTLVRIEGLSDERFSTLCAGLLLRDPQRRWKFDEVRRWLAGDATLTRPVDTAGNQVRLYHIGTQECRTPSELAAGMAAHWKDALADLSRGAITKWLDNEWHDHNLLRRIHDALAHRGTSTQRKLLDCLILLDHRLPPVWMGQALNGKSLLVAARRAGDDEDCRRWLDALRADDVLAAWAAVGNADIAAIDRAWVAARASFQTRWSRIEGALTTARKAGQTHDGSGSARVVDFDAMVYGNSQLSAHPPADRVEARLLCGVLDPAWLAQLRAADDLTAQPLAKDCPWFADLLRVGHDDIGGIVARHFVLPIAAEDAKRVSKERECALAARQMSLDDAEKRLSGLLLSLIAAFRQDDTDAARRLIDQLFDELARAKALTDALPVADRLRAAAGRYSAKLPRVLAALDTLEYRVQLRRIWLKPQRIAVAAAGVVVIYSAFDWPHALVALAAAGAWIAHLCAQVGKARLALDATIAGLVPRRAAPSATDR